MASISFLLDEHVARALRRRGIDVETVSDAGLLGAPDTEILRYASESSRVVVTQDRHFLSFAGERAHTGIAYCEHGTRTIGQLVDGLLLIYGVLEEGDMAGRVEYL